LLGKEKEKEKEKKIAKELFYYLILIFVFLYWALIFVFLYCAMQPLPLPLITTNTPNRVVRLFGLPGRDSPTDLVSWMKHARPRLPSILHASVDFIDGGDREIRLLFQSETDADTVVKAVRAEMARQRYAGCFSGQLLAVARGHSCQ